MKSPKRMLAALAVAYSVSLAAHADCVLPPAPSKIPDGKTASEQEMVTAMQTLKEYNGDVDTYLKCLEFEAKQNRLSAGDQEKHAQPGRGHAHEGCEQVQRTGPHLQVQERLRLQTATVAVMTNSPGAVARPRRESPASAVQEESTRRR